MESMANHLEVIKQILFSLNSQSDNPFVLKGGTALSICYSLNRFSEDIDLDAPREIVPRDRFKDEIQRFCTDMGYSYRISKDTLTTQRAYINYGNPSRPLKVEVSYRRNEIPRRLICIRDGIQVYTLDEMARLKAAAYNGRDKIRDLYDVAYICTHYYDELSESARDALRTALEYKDLEQFDYIIRSQKDELIDPDRLETMFLEAFDKLGLLSPKAEISEEPLFVNNVPLDEQKVSLETEARSCRASSKALDEPSTSEPPKSRDDR